MNYFIYINKRCGKHKSITFAVDVSNIFKMATSYREWNYHIIIIWPELDYYMLNKCLNFYYFYYTYSIITFHTLIDYVFNVFWTKSTSVTSTVDEIKVWWQLAVPERVPSSNPHGINPFVVSLINMSHFEINYIMPSTLIVFTMDPRLLTVGFHPSSFIS